MISLTAILVATLVAQPQERRDTRPPQTDQTVAVTARHPAAHRQLRRRSERARLGSRLAARASASRLAREGEPPNGSHRAASLVERGTRTTRIDRLRDQRARMDVDQDRRPVQLRHHRRHASGGLGRKRPRRYRGQRRKRRDRKVGRGRHHGRRRQGQDHRELDQSGHQRQRK